MAVARLTFGQGLDRDTGIAAVEPATMRELTNMLPQRGKVQARKGMQWQSELPSQGGEACAAVVLLQPLISQQEALAVGWYSTSRELHVYRLSGTATSPTHLGLWATLAAGAVPKVMAAENFATVLLAHDEPLVGRRAATMVYSVFEGTLTPLTAEFDESGVAPIRHRGVMEWGDYLVGWGFGSALEDHPEYLRLSLPGQPLVWDATHYFIAGSRGEPITTVKEAGGNLIAFKASRAHRVVGSSALNFGIMPLYALIGCVSDRLAITVEGSCFFRSLESWHVTTGADAPDIARVLDLEGPPPTDLPAAVDVADAFAVYIPNIRVIEWIFGEMTFVLSLGEQDGLKWSYGSRAVATVSGALLYAGGVALNDDLNQPPESFSTISDIVATATVAFLTLAHTDSDGNEMGEVWLRPLGGEWSIWKEFAVGTSPQVVELENLDPIVEYEVAVRHRRGGIYTTGYTDADPTEWPSASYDTFTTELGAPTLDSVVWARTSASSERARVTFTAADSGVSHKVMRDGILVATLDPGVSVVDITAITGETEHEFTVRAAVGIHESDLSNAITRYMGPATPPVTPEHTDMEDSCGGANNDHTVTWTMGVAGAETEIHVAGVLWATAAANAESGNACADPADPEITLRHKVTTFGVPDYTEFVESTEAP